MEPDTDVCNEEYISHVIGLAKRGMFDELKREDTKNIIRVSEHIVPAAAGYGHLDIIKWIKSLGCDVHGYNHNGWGNCCKYGRIDVARFLLEQPEVDPMAQGGYGLSWACKNDHVEIVKLFLDRKIVRPWHNSNSLLQAALENGSRKVSELLVNQGCHIRTPYIISLVVYNGWSDMLVHCDRIDSDDLPITAAKFNHLDILVKLVTEYGLSPNERQSKGLMYGCQHGNFKMIRFLSEYPQYWNNRNGVCIKKIKTHNNYEMTKYVNSHMVLQRFFNRLAKG